MTIDLCSRGARCLALALAAAASTGCAALLPDAKKLEVQQGKVLDKADIAALERGQSRDRVRELLGDPVLARSFHADRWDYVYYRTRAGEAAEERQRLSLFFGDAGLERIEDRYTVPDNPMPEAPGGRLPSAERPARGGGGSPTPGPSGPGPSGPQPGPGP